MSQLTVVPQGHIESGIVNYTVTGDQLQMSGTAKVSVGWFSREFSFSKAYTAQPGELLKSAFATPGAKLVFAGGIELTVLQVTAGQSHCQVLDPALSLSGVCTIDVSGDLEQPAEILRVDGQATVHGITQQVTAVKS